MDGGPSGFQQIHGHIHFALQIYNSIIALQPEGTIQPVPAKTFRNTKGKQDEREKTESVLPSDRTRVYHE